MPTKTDLPQGTLDLLILKVVAMGPIHGYAISQRMQLISKDVVQVQQGSLYPALHRLENRKLLQAEWRPTDTGRDAKFYSLTAVGKAELAKETKSWDRLTEAVRLILQASAVMVVFFAATLSAQIVPEYGQGWLPEFNIDVDQRSVPRHRHGACQGAPTGGRHNVAEDVVR